ncbi:hypothetical protein A3K73_04475 [Candidatus Pacearchaeota archaeon RBG_13_36_9]|nr:MAG: hypothetical protein A3K73_04475 [Candidatus Pacearchaeota archaeon RBG_13_36_9]
MKKESWKILGLVLIGIIFISLVANFVAAQVLNSTFDPVRNMFAKWGADGDISQNVAKYLFIILVTLLIWSIIDMIGLVKSNPIKWIMSAIIGFLAVGYLTPNEIWVTLSSYSALGMTLLFMLPFVILLFFTIRITAEGGAQGYFFGLLMWIAYLLFLAYRLIMGMVFGLLDTKNPSTWISVTVWILALLVVIFYKTFTKWVGKEVVEGTVQSAERIMKMSVERDKLNADALKRTGQPTG